MCILESFYFPVTRTSINAIDQETVPCLLLCFACLSTGSAACWKYFESNSLSLLIYWYYISIISIPIKIIEIFEVFLISRCMSFSVKQFSTGNDLYSMELPITVWVVSGLKVWKKLIKKAWMELGLELLCCEEALLISCCCCYY